MKASMAASPGWIPSLMLASACALLSSCFVPERMCDCALELNLRMRIRDGSDGACISGAEIRINGGVPVEALYDSLTCQYPLYSGSGTLNIVVAKEGYDTLALDPLLVRYHDDDCCGNLDDKSIEIRWHRSETGLPPEIGIR